MASKMIFINLPVADLERSKTFYETLGWKVNQEFTDDNAACVVVDDNICVMLLIEPFFENFTQRPLSDTTVTIGSIYALALAGTHEVDELTEAAIRAGGTEEFNPNKRALEQEAGMYSRTFIDPDGHQWESFWMNYPHE